jgi:hypothetical protein
MLYTKDHLWIRGGADDTYEIGITAKGNELIGGITFVEVMPNSIMVEGVKTCVDIAVDANKPMFTLPFDGWQEDKPIAGLPAGTDLVALQPMGEEDYKKYCESL